MKFKELTIDGGIALQLRRMPFFGGGSSGEAMGLLFNLMVIRRAHNDKLRQVKKRKVKLKRLMRNMPREGRRAKEIFGARKK
jgi:hypothetical protein